MTSKELFKNNNVTRTAQLSNASYVHKDRLDALNLNVVLDNFVDGLVHRLGILAKY